MTATTNHHHHRDHDMKNKIDKPAIGVAIAFVGIVACAALALLFHWLHPHLPEIREFLLWALDPRLVMGMVLGILIAAGVVWCAISELDIETEDTP
ncbi:MAG TPA: hypothetical protein VGE09_11120 [Pseudoxanthomonas sp.]